MTNKNPDALIYGVSYGDIEKFHMFMREFKTRGDIFEKYAHFLCERLSLEPGFLNSFDFFVFVPSLTPERTNYSLELARFVSAKLNKPLRADVLKKIRNTRELKTLPREERHEEIKDSFGASLNGGERVCIVDDVTASGATLSEITSALKNAGAAYVCAAVVAVYLPQLKTH